MYTGLVMKNRPLIKMINSREIQLDAFSVYWMHIKAIVHKLMWKLNILFIVYQIEVHWLIAVNMNR